MATQRAVIVADGDVDAATLEAAMTGTDGVPEARAARTVAATLGPGGERGHDLPLLIGADGGARKAEALGWLPALVIGDADSLAVADIERYRAMGIEIELHPAEKDESDLELCIAAALARGAGEVRICGALAGARVEHAAANLLLMGHPMLDGRNVALGHRGAWIRRIGTAQGAGSVELRGAPTDYVSLLPLDPTVLGVTTDGLRYPLRGEPLSLGPTRGLSNELIADRARVTCERGRLLVIQTPRSIETEAHRS